MVLTPGIFGDVAFSNWRTRKTVLKVEETIDSFTDMGTSITNAVKGYDVVLHSDLDFDTRLPVWPNVSD